MNKPITVREVAARAGVSIGTVSRVINDEENVAADLRERVLRAVDETGYRPNRRRRRADEGAAGAAVEEITFFVALRDIDEERPALDYFWAGILAGADRQARRSALRITYQALHGLDHGESIVGQLQGHVPARALLAGPAPDRAIAELSSLGVQFVLVDNEADGRSIPSVTSDNFGGSLAVMDHLLALGHERIAYIGGPPSETYPAADAIHSINLRTLAYRHALERRGLPVDPALVERSDLTPDGGWQAMERLFARGAQFTAVYCANDPAATGAIRAARERGIDVPGALSVAGYDDQFGDNVQPRLTTVRVHRAQLGAVAVDALLELTRTPDRPVVRRVLASELVVGASTATATATAGRAAPGADALATR